MNGRALRTLVAIGLLILSIVLAARGAALVSAAPLPKIATPTTAHVSLELSERIANTTSGESFEVTASGQGDIDNARQAMQFSYEVKIPDLGGTTGAQPESLKIAVVAVDDRLYMLDPTTQRWTWTALPAGYATQELAPDFGDFADLGDDFAFTQVGHETVNGAATTHWHMEFDFAKLFSDPDLAPDPASSALPPMIIAYDLWIGDADSYLHRVSVKMSFSAPDDADEGLGGSFSMLMTMTYSDFDQPVKIVAPANATPQTEGDTPELANGIFSSLLSLPLGGSSFGLPADSGTTTGVPSAPAASPTPRPNRGGIVIATSEPTATAKPTFTPTPAATATKVATATPTALPPTATLAIAANASLPPTAVAPPPVAAAPAAQQSQVAPASRSPLPLILGSVALAALLALSGGLIVAGRRMK
ncbi:MAG: hypothetical protein U0232_23520 [Thermomicrobiales bacterium]